MPLYHDEDQAMLAETVEQFMAEQGGIQKQLRHWRDRNCKDGFGHELWKQFAEMGFTGILVGEDHGGLDMGHVEAGIVLEEMNSAFEVGAPSLPQTKPLPGACSRSFFFSSALVCRCAEP